MFSVSAGEQNALARLKAITTIHSTDVSVVQERIKNFLANNLQDGEQVDILLSGESGDKRSLPYYIACEALLGTNTTVARFKHMCGEYPTASSFALWLASNFVGGILTVPQHMIKKHEATGSMKNILIYNTHKVGQHGCMLVSIPE
jgi:hypothetical protein